MDALESSPAPWWARPAPELDGTGLDSAETAARLAAQGPNRIDSAPVRPLALQMLRKLANPLLLLLLGAAALSALAGAITDLAVIVSIVAIGLTLEFVQEHRASRAVERLRAKLALRCRVWRRRAFAHAIADRVL